MNQYEKTLKIIEQQENELQFTEFSNDDALTIGNILVALAGKENLAVTIDITRFGQQLFHYAFNGTSADNDRWIKGKIKIACLMNHSSYYCELYFKNRGTTIEDDFHLPHTEYLPYGGCFPIMIANTGMIGTISVSGLASEDDHALVIKAISQYMDKD